MYPQFWIADFCIQLFVIADVGCISNPIFYPTLGILSHPVRGWWRGIQSPSKRKVLSFHAPIPSFGEPGSLGHLPFFSCSKSRFSSTGCLRSITMPRLSFDEATVLRSDDNVANRFWKRNGGSYLSFNNSCTFRKSAIVTSFRVVIHDPLPGCWWPLNRGSKGHELNHLVWTLIFSEQTSSILQLKINNTFFEGR